MRLAHGIGRPETNAGRLRFEFRHFITRNCRKLVHPFVMKVRAGTAPP